MACFGRPPDLLDVVVLAADPHALLDAGGPPVRGHLLAQEVREELVHAGVREKRRPGVVRHEAGGRDLDVAARDEEVHKGAPKPVRIHSSQDYPAQPGPGRADRPRAPVRTTRSS